MARHVAAAGLTALLAAAAIAPAVAEWTIVNNVAMAIGVAASESRVIVTGSADNSGADIFLSTDGGVTLTTMPHDQQALYMAVDSVDGVEGVAGSLGFWGQTAVGSVTTDGQLWNAVNYVPLFSAAQSVTSAGNGVNYLVGYWLGSFNATAGDGVIVTRNNGQVVEFYPWNQTYPARYGDFPSPTTWFISGGTWPAQTTKQTKRHQVNERFTLTQTESKRVELQYNPPRRTDGDLTMREPGYEGIIARTTDGGATFQTVYADSGRFYFNGIDCVDTRHCWAVAEGPLGGWILATNDSGATWTEQHFVATGGFFMVRMINLNEGWAAGGIYLSNTFNALFLRTFDGGNTWVAEPEIKNAVVNALTVVNSNLAYATAFLRVDGSSLMVYRS